MKNNLFPKSNRLLIKFKRSNNLKERIESFRTTSEQKAQEIINKRNNENILFASFGTLDGVLQTDKKLQLSKFKTFTIV